MKNNKEFYVTEEGYNNIKEELTELVNVKRPANIQAIKEARALGDLKENADYHAARDEQAELEDRIRKLEVMLENAVIITPEDSSHVKIGNSVKIKYVEEEELEEYKIVGSLEADPLKNRISNESPIAKAILGYQPGDVVTVESPNGRYNVEIIEIC
ncbi:MAG: transcription elongation factor GreA [Bacilli bacterium]|nr:transcription elongation factor GreA [Bacilli bacterium]